MEDRCMLWKLREREIAADFRDEIRKKAENRMTGGVNLVWNQLKEGLIAAADKCCGRAKRKHQRHETWWWNDEVAHAVKEKRRLFQVAHKSSKEEDKEAYRKAKQEAGKQLLKQKNQNIRDLGICLTEKMDVTIYSR